MTKSLKLMLMYSALLVFQIFWMTIDAFAHPGTGIIIDATETIYYVSPENRIYRLNTNGQREVFVSDIPNETANKLRAPHHLSMDKEGNLYCVGDIGGIVWKFSPDGKWKQFFPAPGQQTPLDHEEIEVIGFGGNPFCIDEQGVIYYVYPALNPTQIRRINLEGKEEIVAGSLQKGFADGKGEKALFGEGPFGSLHGSGFAWGPNHELYVTDNSRLRKISPTGEVTTVAGRCIAGHENASVVNAIFNQGAGLAVSQNGEIFVAEYGNRAVRKIGTDLMVSTLYNAGGGWIPTGLAMGNSGKLYALEFFGSSVRVREIDLETGAMKVIANSLTSPPINLKRISLLVLTAFFLFALAWFLARRKKTHPV